MLYIQDAQISNTVMLLKIQKTTVAQPTWLQFFRHKVHFIWHEPFVFVSFLLVKTEIKGKNGQNNLQEYLNKAKIKLSVQEHTIDTRYIPTTKTTTFPPLPIQHQFSLLHQHPLLHHTISTTTTTPPTSTNISPDIANHKQYSNAITTTINAAAIIFILTNSTNSTSFLGFLC